MGHLPGCRAGNNELLASAFGEKGLGFGLRCSGNMCLQNTSKRALGGNNKPDYLNAKEERFWILESH